MPVRKKAGKPGVFEDVEEKVTEFDIASLDMQIAQQQERIEYHQALKDKLVAKKTEAEAIR